MLKGSIHAFAFMFFASSLILRSENVLCSADGVTKTKHSKLVLQIFPGYKGKSNFIVSLCTFAHLFIFLKKVLRTSCLSDCMSAGWFSSTLGLSEPNLKGFKRMIP